MCCVVGPLWASQNTLLGAEGVTCAPGRPGSRSGSLVWREHCCVHRAPANGVSKLPSGEKGLAEDGGSWMDGSRTQALSKSNGVL